MNKDQNKIIVINHFNDSLSGSFIDSIEKKYSTGKIQEVNMIKKIYFSNMNKLVKIKLEKIFIKIYLLIHNNISDIIILSKINNEVLEKQNYSELIGLINEYKNLNIIELYLNDKMKIIEKKITNNGLNWKYFWDSI